MPSMLDLANSADLKYYGWIVTSTVSVGILTYALLKLSMKKRRDQKRNSYPKDTVVLHQFPRSSHTPSLSTPCLKLETCFYKRIRCLRMSNFNDYHGQLTQNGKTCS